MRRSSGVLAGLLLVLLAAAPVLASDYSVGIGTPTLSRSRVAVNVPVQLTCPAQDPAYDLLIQSVTVDVSQAVGKRIAHGEGGAGGRDFIICDGTPKSVVVGVTADPSGPPFSGGWMSVSAHAEFLAGIEAFPGCGCGQIYVDQFASAGPVDRKAG